MDNQQRAKLDAYNRVSDFNKNHQTNLAAISEYAPEQQKFDVAVAALKKAGEAQIQPGTNQLISLAAKQKMADIVTKYSLRGGVKARSLNNKELAHKLQGSSSAIFKATKTKALEISANRQKALSDNLSILTNITSSNIDEITQAIAAYDKIKDAPTETKQTQKSSGTDPLTGFFTDADDAENNMHELIVSYFADAQPELVSEFEVAKQVISTGIRTTSINFTCLDDETGKPIMNFTVTDQSNNKTYHPNDKGIVTIEHHLAGHFHFTIAATGYTDVDFIADIKRGTTNNFTVRLKKSA